jgi:hypothetical protein
MAPHDWNNSRDDVMQSLGRIEARLEEHFRILKEVKEDVEDATSRVSELERSKAWLLGAAAAVSALIGFAAQHVPLK